MSNHKLRINFDLNKILAMYTRKPCYRKDDRAMRPIYGCPENFQESMAMPMATFLEIFNGLLLRSIVCSGIFVPVQNLS